MAGCSTIPQANGLYVLSAASQRCPSASVIWCQSCFVEMVLAHPRFASIMPSELVKPFDARSAAKRPLLAARPGFFDLAAVCETVKIARERNKPYAVVINAAPVKRDEKEAPAVAASRAKLDALGIPVWSGQISQRAGYMASLAAGFSAGEVAPDSSAGQEIARLWSAVERSVAAIRGAQADAGGMHSRAA